VFGRAAEFLRDAGQVHDDDPGRRAALALRRADRATDEPVVGVLRHARDRPGRGRRRAATLETDSDGAELQRRHGHRPAARHLQESVYELEVHQPLTSVRPARDV